MKFECNCKSDRQLAKLTNALHKEDNGFNFEVAARLWHTPASWDKTIMVEFQVATQTCRNLTEDEDEPDWFTAYEVEDEHDNDCSCEIFTETADDYISLSGLKAAMLDFAKEVANRIMCEKPSLDNQIQTALSRAVESQPDSSAKGKAYDQQTLCKE